MITIALTGSIGMGKSTVAAMFAAAGIPLFDADREVRRMQGPGGSLVAAIGDAFPSAMRDGGLDREALAAIAFTTPENLRILEAITHPVVAAARAEFVARHRHDPALLFDIPLLFETSSEGAFDTVIVVSAPAAVQRRRVLARPGMNDGKLDSVLARQMNDADKRARADFIIDTSGDVAATEAQVRHILACLGLAQGG
ncbi:MAG: dephospho-CoA kinase [Sphingomicrobium sp.]